MRPDLGDSDVDVRFLYHPNYEKRPIAWNLSTCINYRIVISGAMTETPETIN